MGYVIWKSANEEGLCSLLAPEGIKDSFELQRGISRNEGWSQDTICRMNDEYPNDIQLADNMHATGLIVISKPMKALLVKENVNNVEFLPLTILNHKGRVASADYFIVNALDICDCIDLDASEVEWNFIEKDLISNCERLVLKEEAIPQNYMVFRPKFKPNIILIHIALVEKLYAANFTGLEFQDPLEYIGI